MSANTAPSKACKIPRKRKAEELSDESGDPAAKDADLPAPLHLPAPVWGHVLDFMPYAEVRSALLVGKPMAAEATKHVQTLKIMKEGEMHIPAARRFANAEEVNILCLLEGTGEMDEEDEIIEQCTISEVASNRIPPFISSFPKLKRTFFGGVLLVDGKQTIMAYDSDECVGPDNHGEVFRSLVLSLFGAFETGALRRDVELPHLAGELQGVSPCADDSHDLDTHSCQRCRNCIQYLPLEDSIYATVYKYPKWFCLKADVIWRLLLERPGIEMGIKHVSEKVLCDVVLRDVRIGTLAKGSESASLSQKWRFDSQLPIHTWYLPKSAFDRLDALMKRGLDPGQIRRGCFFEKLGRLIGVNHNYSSFSIWSESTVEGLAARGFPIDCNSIPVIEDRFCYFIPRVEE